jgi:hypothetical protein
MEDTDFLNSAASLADQYPDDALSIAFMKEWSKPDLDHNACMTLGAKLILKLIDVV